jgi:hypothetical protein
MESGQVVAIASQAVEQIQSLRTHRDLLQKELGRVQTSHVASLERVAKLERVMEEAEWMVRGHVTGPETREIWLRYQEALSE